MGVDWSGSDEFRLATNRIVSLRALLANQNGRLRAVLRKARQLGVQRPVLVLRYRVEDELHYFDVGATTLAEALADVNLPDFATMIMQIDEKHVPVVVESPFESQVCWLKNAAK